MTNEEMLKVVLSGLNEYYSHELGEKIKRGKRLAKLKREQAEASLRSFEQTNEDFSYCVSDLEEYYSYQDEVIAFLNEEDRKRAECGEEQAETSLPSSKINFGGI